MGRCVCFTLTPGTSPVPNPPYRASRVFWRAKRLRIEPKCVSLAKQMWFAFRALKPVADVVGFLLRDGRMRRRTFPV